MNKYMHLRAFHGSELLSRQMQLTEASTQHYPVTEYRFIDLVG